MLKNPGFETEWSAADGGHWCEVYKPDGTMELKEIGNIFVPPKWKMWFYHDQRTDENKSYSQPEVRDAWIQNDKRRVHEGLKATLLFTFCRRHLAGFSQQVQVELGQRLRLTAWAHAWSNHLGEDQGGRPHDPKWSDGYPVVGYNIVALEDSQVPPLNQEPQNDAIGNFGFEIGIDPTGGTNPFSETVIWGQRLYIYNGYVEPLVVEAVAQNATVTVFLKSKTMWAFTHNDAYWDNVELTVVSSEPEPEPSDYESTMLVLPQDATPAQLSEILAAAYPNRRTFGFSHDDAVALNGTAVLYNIPDVQKELYLDWYAARNTNVVIK